VKCLLKITPRLDVTERLSFHLADTYFESRFAELRLSAFLVTFPAAAGAAYYLCGCQVLY
jgi:hypothetical protein